MRKGITFTVTAADRRRLGALVAARSPPQRQHVRNNVLTITQQKTGQQVSIPLHPDLKRVLDSLPNDNLTFLVSDRGGPLKPESFTNWFKRMVQDAGFSGLLPHGLRKATCRMLAESGCTPHQIMAISGHKTLSEVTRYTVAASRTQLSEDAMASLGKIKKGT